MARTNKAKFRYKPIDMSKPYKPKFTLDLSKATALTIDELRKSIAANRLVTITIQIN